MAQDRRGDAVVYFCSAGSDLLGTVLYRALGLEFTNMTEEDEEFQRLEREAKMRRMAEEDDDIQDYVRPWVGLTDEEIKEIVGPYGDTPITGYTRKLFDQIEAKLKEKNT